MKISEAIKLLTDAQKVAGDLEVCFVDEEDGFFSFAFPEVVDIVGIPDKTETKEILVCGFMDKDLHESATEIEPEPHLKVVK